MVQFHSPQNLNGSPKPKQRSPNTDFYSFILINMGKTEAMYITPDDVLQNQTEEFFDFQFKVVAGQPVECTYKGEKVDENLGAWLFLVREYYLKKCDKLKAVKAELKRKQEKYKSDLEVWMHAKHCYQSAIAHQTEQSNHWKYTVRAFEQLAKANENTQKEIEKDKKQKFSIWD